MEEYPDLDDEFLEKLSVTKIQADKIRDRSMSIVGKVMGWLFDQFAVNTHLFTDEIIDQMATKGQMLYNDLNRRKVMVDGTAIRAYVEEDVSILDGAKRESGGYPPLWFTAEVGRMVEFCESHSYFVERYCMQLGLRAGSGIGLAAYFYQPALKWGLLKSLFEK